MEKVIKKYDIWLADFPFRENNGEYKTRPVIALEDGKVLILTAPVTSHSPRIEYEKEYELKDWQKEGLSRPSVVRLTQSEDILRDWYVHKLGHLTDDDISNLETLLVESVDVVKDDWDKKWEEKFGPTNITKVMSVEDTLKELKKMEEFDPAQEIKNEEEISNATEPEEMVNRGLADMINELIKSEYDAITDYNNAISTIVAENKMLELIPIFEDIREEENVHVGQLQKALQQVSDAADNIDKGVKEAEGQLEEPPTEEEE